MKKKLLKITAFLLSVSLIFTSCDPDDLSLNQDANKSLQESVLTESVINDVVVLVNKGTNNVKSSLETQCGDYNFDEASNTLTISFPQEGCTGEDGIKRSGIIKAQFKGIWTEKGSTITVSFDAYKKDDTELSGKLTMTFTTAGLQPEFTVTSSNMILTFEDGSKITWTGSTSYKYNGLTTPLDLTDDYFIINGAAEGINKEGKSFAQVATELKSTTNCKWFVGGNLKITITDNTETDVYDLSFKETCGNVDVIYNGVPFTLNLDD